MEIRLKKKHYGDFIFGVWERPVDNEGENFQYIILADKVNGSWMISDDP